MFEIQYRWIIACQRFRSQLNLITAKQFDELIKVSFWNFSKCLECVFERYIEAYIQVKYFSPTNTKIYFLPRLRVIYQSHRFWTRFLSLSLAFLFSKKCACTLFDWSRFLSFSFMIMDEISRYHDTIVYALLLDKTFCHHDFVHTILYVNEIFHIITLIPIVFLR